MDRVKIRDMLERTSEFKKIIDKNKRLNKKQSMELLHIAEVSIIAMQRMQEQMRLFELKKRCGNDEQH